MAVKVAILGVALAPRMARIGQVAVTTSADVDAELSAPAGSPVRRRAVQAIAALALVVLAFGTAYAASQSLSGASLAVAPVVTPWVRERPPAVVGSGLPIRSPGPGHSAPPGASAGPGASGSPGASPSPTPKPGPFSMDLYEKGDYVGEFHDIWCLPAAMQTAMNIMDEGADTSRATQERLFDFTRSLHPAPDGAAEPEAWAEGLTQLGYGNYEVDIEPSIKAAIKVAARQIRLTNRPVGLMVWKGAHSWVMSGFNATADPAQTDDFTVTAVRIEDVWYPRLSSIWGYSRSPDSLYKVEDLSEDYLPWKRPLGTYPKKTGNFVLVIPVE